MKSLKVTHIYNMPVDFDAWVIDFVKKEGGVLAIIVFEDGEIDTQDIKDIRVKLL